MCRRYMLVFLICSGVLFYDAVMLTETRVLVETETETSECELHRAPDSLSRPQHAQEAVNDCLAYAIAAPTTVLDSSKKNTPHSKPTGTRKWCPLDGSGVQRNRASSSNFNVFAGTAQEQRACPLDGSGPEGVCACALDERKILREKLFPTSGLVCAFKLAFTSSVLGNISVCFFVFDAARHAAMHMLYSPPGSDIVSLWHSVKACWEPYSGPEPLTGKEIMWISAFCLIMWWNFNMSRLSCVVFWYLCKYIDAQIRYVLSICSSSYDEYDNTVPVEPVSSSDTKVTCPICMVYETNTVTKCGHTFCYDCLARVHEFNNDEDTPCPICKQNITGMSTIYHNH